MSLQPTFCLYFPRIPQKSKLVTVVAAYALYPYNKAQEPDQIPHYQNYARSNRKCCHQYQLGVAGYQIPFFD